MIHSMMWEKTEVKITQVTLSWPFVGLRTNTAVAHPLFDYGLYLVA